MMPKSDEMEYIVDSIFLAFVFAFALKKKRKVKRN
jgi:hypothetical protein